MKPVKRIGIWDVVLIIIMIAGGPVWGTAERGDHGERGKTSAGPPDSGATEAAEQNSGVSLSLKKGDLEIRLDVPAAGVGVPSENQTQGHPKTNDKRDPSDPYKETREQIVEDKAKGAMNRKSAAARAKEAHDRARSTAQDGRKADAEALERARRLLDDHGNAYRGRDESTLDLGSNDNLGDF